MKSLIKFLFPMSFIKGVLALLQTIDTVLIQLLSQTRITAWFYYLIFNRKFDRELISVLKGRSAYYKGVNSKSDTSALLRRNIHRVEKGLIMQPRRGLFAEGFILETVVALKSYTESLGYDVDEMKWASDVLFEYFRAVSSSPVVSKAKAIFDSIDVVDSGEFLPYKYAKLPVPSISSEDLKLLFLKRRSVRWYKDVTVPLDLIKMAAEMASLAPSACNRQPYQFYVANEKEKAYRIAKLAGGTPGWVSSIQCIVVFVGDLSAYSGEHDRHAIYVDASLAAMQFILSLETLGLSSCCINWPDINHREKEMKDLLGLNDYERPIMLLSVGYASGDGGIPYSQKKSADNLIVKV